MKRTITGHTKDGGIVLMDNLSLETLMRMDIDTVEYKYEEELPCEKTTCMFGHKYYCKHNSTYNK